MNIRVGVRVVMTVLVLTSFGRQFPAVGQESPPAAPPVAGTEPLPDEQREDFTKLPPPLDVVSGNMLDLETSGYFRIIKAEYRRTNVHADEALIWTVHVIKPITARHAILLLEKFRDVRFYRTVINPLTKQKRELELITRTLHHSPHLDDGSFEMEMLDVDETFNVWILLTEEEIISLKNRVADTIKLSRSGPDIRDRYRTLDGEHGNPWAR